MASRPRLGAHAGRFCRAPGRRWPGVAVSAIATAVPTGFPEGKAGDQRPNAPVSRANMVHCSTNLGASAEQGGDVDDLPGGLSESQAALHRNRAQLRESFLFARVALPHQDAFRALDEL